MYNNKKYLIGDIMKNEIKEVKIMVTLAGKYRGPYFEKIKAFATFNYTSYRYKFQVDLSDLTFCIHFINTVSCN